MQVAVVVSDPILDEIEYLEVQTPILGRNYNGGRSYPVVSSYLGNKIGFNRTTMEDRLQALIAAGHERIFEIGSIFRSNQERTFLEIYAAFLSPVEGKRMVKDLLAHFVAQLVQDGIGNSNQNADAIAAGKWYEVEFLDGARNFLGIDPVAASRDPKIVTKEVLRCGLITKGDITSESLADVLGQAIAKNFHHPGIVNGFPVWSSPLYAVARTPGLPTALERSRIYLPDGRWGFEFGLGRRGTLDTLHSR